MKKLTNYLLVITLLLLVACSKKESNPVSPPQISDVQYVTAGDIKMAYRTIGEGYPLLLCMGFTGVMDL